jgi:hypothetical protein
MPSFSFPLNFTPVFTSFFHLRFTLCNNLPNIFNSMILLQLIIELYAIYSFVYCHLLPQSCCFRSGVFLHFGKYTYHILLFFTWVKFLFPVPLVIPLSFRIHDRNHANPIFSFKLHWSVLISLHHSSSHSSYCLTQFTWLMCAVSVLHAKVGLI